MGIDQHGGAVGRMLQCVGDDVGEQLAQAVLIAFHRDVGRHGDADVVGVAAIGDFQRLDGLVKKVGEVELFDIQTRRTGLHTAQIQQEGDEVGETLRLGEDALQIGGSGLGDAVGHVLDHRLQSGNGRAQLMAHIGDHVAAHFIGMLEFAGHLVERASQLADLVMTILIDIHADRVIAIRHGFGHIAHLA